MSAPALEPAVVSWNSRRRRTKQRKVGPSDVGICRRQGAYKHLRVKPSNLDNSGMAAALGTWIHKGALAVLAAQYGCVIEAKVETDQIKGSVDSYYPDQFAVDDLKTKSTYAMDSVRSRGPKRKELFQTHLYALLLREGASKDKRLVGPQRVDTVRLRYVNRDNGDEWVYEQPYDERIAADAMFWLGEIQSCSNPEDMPRDQDGPGLSAECDWCPFLDLCWGPERPDGLARQTVLIRNDADAEAALIQYEQARAAEQAADAQKKKAKAMLEASEPGQYGGLVLGWSEPEAKPKPDVERMLELFDKAGLEVPLRYEKAARRISVTKPKAAKQP
jgi:hypothetical protein